LSVESGVRPPHSKASLVVLKSEDAPMPKRSLMLAGGGLKIAFQAGVLQVWLDEMGIKFDHADGVSAACFNVAMWAQGMSGRQIADHWRNFKPLAAIGLNWRQLLRLFRAESIFTLNAFRKKFFREWGLDWNAIRSSGREATFNVYNFSQHKLRPVTAPELTEDFLIASGSLPLWFPPVRIAGDTYIDAVFNTGSNLEEAIRRGADELWVIWTTSTRGQWLGGLVGNFFGIFEATTNGGYRQVRDRIDENNAAIARGETGEFGRQITIRELQAEVSLHYLFNFRRRRFAEAVERGVEAARHWCASNDPEHLSRTAATVERRISFIR
jgi:predicted acylesterase/phospholipase RssA